MFRVNFHSIRSFWQWRATFKGMPIVQYTISALYWAPIGIMFNQYFYTVKIVTGRSMQPTLNPDTSKSRDIVILDRMAIKELKSYARGDVVALWSPVERKLLIKRIIALEGDSVKTLPPYPDKDVCVPEGSVWVEGDESFRTDDSNYFGPVPLALLDSKLSFIVWPLERWGPINQQSVPRVKWRKSRVAEAISPAELSVKIS